MCYFMNILLLCVYIYIYMLFAFCLEPLLYNSMFECDMQFNVHVVWLRFIMNV